MTDETDQSGEVDPNRTRTVGLRLTEPEIEHLDALAAAQSVPVDRGALLAHVVRAHLRSNPIQAPTKKARTK